MEMNDNNNLFLRFLQFENQKKYFDIEIEGFKIWEIMRTYIFIDIENYFNDMGSLFPDKNKMPKHRQLTFNILKNSLKIFFLKKQDYLFLNNPRRVKQDDGKYYCIYTDLYIDLLIDKKCITFEDPYWALSKTSYISHYEPVKTDNICYLDIVERIVKFKSIFYKKSNSYKQLHKAIYSIKKEIEGEFKCDLSYIFDLSEKQVIYMILSKKIYNKALKKMQPKAILEFYDVFPSKIVINKIAKEMQIPIIEIQHGVVTEQNPLFLKYLDLNRNYDCIPDYVLSYGKKLLNTKYMPINKNRIYYTGSLFLEKKKEEYKNIKSDKKNILFVSQCNLANFISNCASELADLLKDKNEYQIIYKMHPYEIGKNFECLKKKNITIIDNREKDLYYYQSKSILQVGIYSTGVYEGLDFGLDTFVLNHQYGTKDVKKVLKEGSKIHYVNDAREIFNMLNNLELNKNTDNEYWSKVDKDNIKNIILSLSKKDTN